ncbi:MAG: SDR family oxidoreductase [Acidobacteria bacterium]|nr:SDR family oxidoreductase [Acidobacteriota bacterium]
MSSESTRRPEILVLGATGMLGHRVALEFARAGAVVRAAARGVCEGPSAALGELLPPGSVSWGFDARDLASVERLLASYRPRVIVNCVGVVKQRPEAADAEVSVAVNALFPHALARMARSFGGRVLHVSTDCVFSGARGGYREDDLCDARDLYGRSKALGELTDGDVLTVRTSIVGRQLTGASSLLEWFLAQPGPAVPGFTGAFFSGVTTLELARVLAALAAASASLRGLYHVAGPRISKRDLLTHFRDAYRKPVEIEPDPRLAVDRSLDGTRFEEAAGWRAPGWPAMIAELAADGVAYDHWRAT